MPKYDYKCPAAICPKHNQIIELTLPMDHETPICEACESSMRQVIGATPAHFKGSGWGGNHGS